jgi:hypothetical protein
MFPPAAYRLIVRALTPLVMASSSKVISLGFVKRIFATLSIVSFMALL